MDGILVGRSLVPSSILNEESAEGHTPLRVILCEGRGMRLNSHPANAGASLGFYQEYRPQIPRSGYGDSCGFRHNMFVALRTTPEPSPMAPKLTLANSSIFILGRLAVILLCFFVFVLAFVAKHAQYDSSAEHGAYLKQCVKMENRVALDSQQPCSGIENPRPLLYLPIFSLVLDLQLRYLTSAPLTLHPPLLI
jgi:hypothetical protein